MKNYKFITGLVSFVVLMFVIYSCNDKLDDKTFFTSDELSIVETLEANPELFSSYLEIIEKTGFYTSFDSYGSYTCFAPTNDAVKIFLKEKWNVESVNALTSEEQIEFLKTVVKFHTIPTSRKTSSFIEGRIADTTYTGDFLTSSYVLGGGIANVQINREAQLNVYDIETSNGVIHALNGVLSPFIDGMPKVIEKSGEHTIFVEALKQTGYYDKWLEIYTETGSKNSFTILAESDEVYAQEGIYSFADLVAYISPDNSNFLNPENDLNRFIGYHATENFLYTADFPNDGFISTILPRNAIKSFKTDKTLKINESETGKNDTWTSLISAQSNFPGKNGVYHTVDKILTIFTPNPKHVIFDIVDGQPEYQRGELKSHVYYPNSTYKNLRWSPEGPRRFVRSGSLAANGNTTFSATGFVWFEVDTPVLPKGKYELLICGQGWGNSRGAYQAYWDGEPIGAIYDLTNRSATGYPDEVLMESRGWRKGNPDFKTTATPPVTAYDTDLFLRFVITKELLLPEQKSHVFRLKTVSSGGFSYDYIEFIPVD